MSLILLIARKEVSELIRDRRLQWTVALLSVLLITSFLVGWQHYRSVTTLRAEAELSQREQWVNKSVGSAHVAAHAGTSVFRPYNALSAIEQGLDSHVGGSMFLEAHRRADFQFPTAEDAARIGGRFAEVTTALTLQVLVPLLIILLAYPAFAGERESGTLRQLLSLGVAKSDLFFGKSLGIAVPLLTVIVPLTLLGAFALLFWSENSRPTAPRLLLMLGCYLIYFGIFFGISLAASAVFATAQKTLIVLLGFWFVACLITPPVAVEVAEYLHRTPTEKELAADAYSESSDDAVKNYKERLAKVEREQMQKYGVQKVEELPVSPSAVLLAEYEAEGAEKLEAAFQKQYGTYERQNTAYQLAGLVSPLIAVQTLSMSFAGTDTNHHRHFAEAAEKYRYRMAQTMNEDLINHPSKGNRAKAEADFRSRERGLYESLPPFTYDSPDWLWATAQAKLSLISLLLWFTATASAIPFVFKRLKS